VHRYLREVLERGEPELPPPRRTHLAVFRRDYQVWRAALERPAFLTLEALAKGQQFGAALGHAGRDAGKVGAWFRDWAADGLFVGAE
jgi:hypothetical protein